MPNLEIGSSGEVKWLHLISKQIIQLTGIVGSISGGTVISGTANTVARFGPAGDTLVDSLIKDDGVTLTVPTLAGVGNRILLADNAGGLSAPAGYLQSQIETSIDGRIVQTITNGDTTHASSSDALYDALALKQDLLGYTAENLANKGIALGYASLDSGGKVPTSQLPASAIQYKGNYNAATNTPTLTDGVGSSGDTYRTNVAGPGVNSLNFVVGDFVIYSGTIWEKSGGSDSVLSAFGRTGTVVAVNGDYTTALVPDTTDKRYQTDNQKLYNDATSSIQTQLNSKQATLTPAALTKTDDTNVTLTLGGTPATALLQPASLTLGWTGTLADARIASASNWNSKQAGNTNLTSLSGLTYVSPSFVKMTSAGTFTLDTNTYPTIITGTVNTTADPLTTINTIPTVTNAKYYIKGVVIGNRTGGVSGAVGDFAAVEFSLAVKNNGGIVSIFNKITGVGAYKDQIIWNVDATVSGTNVLIQVSGAINNNITWTSEFKINQG